MNNESAGAPVCGKCGATLRAAALFCARCGTRVSAEEAAAEVRAETAPPSTDRWQALRVVGWLFGLLLTTSLAFGIAYHVDPAADLLVWESLVFGIVVAGFAVQYEAEILALLHPSALGQDAWGKLAIATVVQFALLGAVFYLLEQTGVPFERITDEMQRHDYKLWQLLALYSLVPAVVEEIAFRGVIFGRLRGVLGEREAWLVQAALFSVLHLSPVIFPTHFVMGLIFGWLRMRTGSLIPGMILHAAWNAAIILLELKGEPA
jgi:membrane protease YdiL (CAAX protease family)